MTDTPDAKAERDTKMRKAYGSATTLLREKHKDEFQLLHQQEAQKLGLDWTPRKSKEQKAREQVNKLLTENPSLRDELMAAAKQQLAGQQPEG